MYNFGRKIKEEKRKRKLGEKYTSSITHRKIETIFFAGLNPKIDMDSIEYVYSLGFFKRTSFWVSIIKKCLKSNLFNLMNLIVYDVTAGEDEMGYTPIKDYVKVYIWKTKKNEFYGQLEGNTFNMLPEKKKSFIICTIRLRPFNPKFISARKLVYPID